MPAWSTRRGRRLGEVEVSRQLRPLLAGKGHFLAKYFHPRLWRSVEGHVCEPAGPDALLDVALEGSPEWRCNASRTNSTAKPVLVGRDDLKFSR